MTLGTRNTKTSVDEKRKAGLLMGTVVGGGERNKTLEETNDRRILRFFSRFSFKNFFFFLSICKKDLIFLFYSF